VGQIIALPPKIRRLIQLYLAYASDNKLVYKLIYRFKWGRSWAGLGAAYSTCQHGRGTGTAGGDPKGQRCAKASGECNVL